MVDVCVCVSACACWKVFESEPGACFGSENVRLALEETPCSSSQVISFTAVKFATYGCVIDRMH